MSGRYSFSPNQISVAQQVLATAQQYGANATEQLALMEAGLVESGMANLNYGDRDSQGVFQERPSQGWTNVTNIPDATIQMLQHFNTSLTDAGAMAQSGERSAYPAKYDAIQPEAMALLQQAGGGANINLAASSNSSSGSSNSGTEAAGWLQSVGLRVGMILFGAMLMLVGMWLALGHSTKELPQMIGGKANG